MIMKVCACAFYIYKQRMLGFGRRGEVGLRLTDCEILFWCVTLVDPVFGELQFHSEPGVLCVGWDVVVCADHAIGNQSTQ